MALKNEELEQFRVVSHLKILEATKKIVHFHATFNEDKVRSSKGVNFNLGVKAKKLGKRAGISDLTIVLENLTLYIEMKNKPKLLKSGKVTTSHTSVSASQRAFIDKVNSTSHSAGVVAYGARNAVSFIKKALQIDSDCPLSVGDLQMFKYELTKRDCI